jgi:hypothetical protein
MFDIDTQHIVHAATTRAACTIPKNLILLAGNKPAGERILYG